MTSDITSSLLLFKQRVKQHLFRLAYPSVSYFLAVQTVFILCSLK